uniref:Si:dkeyp-77c8.3 n=1 Tax=Kryptolebias marmoratus TaxID=37003 RepID=A0A3Q2ZCD6_KRYMA
LSPSAMARQVKEAQEYRDVAQLQVSVVSQLREADAADKDILCVLEDQWSSIVQDAATVIHSKETQLQLVSDYCTQIQMAKTKLDQLTAELDAVKSPEQSSCTEAGQLTSLQKRLEENRIILGELLLTHTRICLILSHSDREAAQTEQKNLQEKWRSLERSVENCLHHT